MLTMLFIWFGLLAALIYLTVRLSHFPLPLVVAYFLGLSLIHVPGVLPYIANINFASGWRDETALGFQITLIGMAAFVVGVAITIGVAKNEVTEKKTARHLHTLSFGLSGWTLFAVGAAAYFVVVPLVRSIPSLTAPIASLGTLIVIGIWIELYRGVKGASLWGVLSALLCTALLPFTTVVSGGFVGYGVYWALSVVAFLFLISERRQWYYLAAPLAVYLGLSFFVNYMAAREEIRYSVAQQSAISERVSQTVGIFSNFEFLDLDATTHAVQLDDRLNQNWLVGAGVRRHRDGLTELAYGSTVPWWAPIPRAVWPEKPLIGGGGDIVTRYTGIRFSADTSVGVGQVLEYYVNFGLAGVVLGFVGLGILLTWIDRRIMATFGSGDLGGLLLYAMPGLTLLQAGGNLLEIVVGVITAVIVAHLLIMSLNFLNVPLKKPTGKAAGLAGAQDTQFSHR